MAANVVMKEYSDAFYYLLTSCKRSVKIDTNAMNILTEDILSRQLQAFRFSSRKQSDARSTQSSAKQPPLYICNISGTRQSQG